MLCIELDQLANLIICFIQYSCIRFCLFVINVRLRRSGPRRCLLGKKAMKHIWMRKSFLQREHVFCLLASHLISMFISVFASLWLFFSVHRVTVMHCCSPASTGCLGIISLIAQRPQISAYLPVYITRLSVCLVAVVVYTLGIIMG